MSLSATPASERVHIGFFGKRNVGKSSVMNAVTGQDLAIVSEQKGTTTDPVYKTMELLPLGPVMLIDTPGLDDEGSLGMLRVKKAYQVLNKTDIALIIVDASNGPSQEDRELLAQIRKKKIPYLIVFNKEELLFDKILLSNKTLSSDNTLLSNNTLPSDKEENARKEMKREMEAFFSDEEGAEGKAVWISAKKGTGIYKLKEQMAHLLDQEKNQRRIVGDLLRPEDFVVLVVPIDKAAPKGRLILPQQQTIRDILETGAAAIVTRDLEYKEVLKKLGRKPDLVITDSQVFAQVAKETPEDVLLTSFSILFARYKGILFPAVEGARALEKLADGDRVLLSEGCTHHRQCGDIGTVKLPNWIRSYTGKDIEFCFTSGTEFPQELSPYQLIVHCGGCMLNEREMNYRLNSARDMGVPMTNYGTLIAYMQGILERSIQLFGKER